MFVDDRIFVSNFGPILPTPHYPEEIRTFLQTFLLPQTLQHFSLSDLCATNFATFQPTWESPKRGYVDPDLVWSRSFGRIQIHRRSFKQIEQMERIEFIIIFSKGISLKKSFPGFHSQLLLMITQESKWAQTEMDFLPHVLIFFRYILQPSVFFNYCLMFCLLFPLSFFTTALSYCCCEDKTPRVFF